MMKSGRCSWRSALVLVLLLSAQGAWAQGYPSKTVKLVAGASPGSASDLVGRAVAEKLHTEFGVPVIMENKPGASGVIAAQYVLGLPADGHAVFVYTAAHTVVPHISKLPYDAMRDFSAVTPLATVPSVLVVAPDKGYTSVQRLVEAAKAKPGQLNYASAGVGSASYMSIEKFRVAAGIDAVHVSYKGAVEALTETMAGRIDFFFSPLVSALPLIKDGKLQALAVGGTTRTAMLPEVPTLLEAGVPKADYLFWIGMLVPAKTPRDVVAKLNQATLKALQAPEVRERLAKLGAEPLPMSPEQFDAHIRDEMAMNARIIKAAGIKSE